MRKLIFAIVAITLASCTANEIDQPIQKQQKSCGIITSMESVGSSGQYEYIYVTMTPNQTWPDKYQIQGVIDDYHLGQEICNFAGMQKVQY